MSIFRTTRLVKTLNPFELILFTSINFFLDIDVYFLSVLVNDKDEIVEITTAEILGMDDKQLMPHLPLIKISKDFYVTQPIVAPKDMFKVAVSIKITRHYCHFTCNV